MKIFIAGASGVIGRRLIPLLITAGHKVGGMTRSADKADMLRNLDATPIVCDVYNFSELENTVTRFQPDIIIQQLTDLPDSAESLQAYGPRNDRMRREGTRNMLKAAKAAGMPRFFVQSIAWKLSGDRGEAVKEMENMVLQYGGVILRYGQLYGPGTFYESEKPEPPRVHIDQAARKTMEALAAKPGETMEIID